MYVAVVVDSITAEAYVTDERAGVGIFPGPFLCHRMIISVSNRDYVSRNQ